MKIEKKIFLFLVLLLNIIACRQTQPESTGISKVTVAFSGYGCESECPFQAFSVDSSLSATFYGDESAGMNGYFQGAISQETWDSIQVRFDKFIVIGLDTVKYRKTDHPEVEFLVRGGFRKHLVRFKENTGIMAEDDLDILYWFVNIASRVSLNSTDSMSFETTLQYPISPRTIEK
ncbi:MAG TPA: DUF6438 domain-containing protein [Cytophagaceae bacterium]